jgi:hypothetical protein
MPDIIQDARQFAAGIALGGEVENMAVEHIEALCGELERLRKACVTAGTYSVVHYFSECVFCGDGDDHGVHVNKADSIAAHIHADTCPLAKEADHA